MCNEICFLCANHQNYFFTGKLERLSLADYTSDRLHLLYHTFLLVEENDTTRLYGMSITCRLQRRYPLHFQYVDNNSRKYYIKVIILYIFKLTIDYSVLSTKSYLLYFSFSFGFLYSPGIYPCISQGLSYIKDFHKKLPFMAKALCKCFTMESC